MILKLQRKKITDKSCIGELLLNGGIECYTLEDPPREKKIPGVTGIPAGEYRLIIDFSNRFQEMMPLLLNVPGFDGIRIHPGNTDEDTEGCILVGDTMGENRIGKSRIAFNRLFKKLSEANMTGKIWVEINNPI